MKPNEERVQEYGFEEYQRKVQEEEKFVDLEDLGQLCSIERTKVINKKDGSGESHLAVLRMEKTGEIRKKWLSSPDRRVIQEAPSNRFVIGKEQKGATIYLALKPAPGGTQQQLGERAGQPAPSKGEAFM